MATCYRHPDRETGVSCSNCGGPICPDCMTPTPVGMRCPECSRDRTPVRTMASLDGDPVADLRADRDQRRDVPRLARRTRRPTSTSCWRPARSPTGTSGGRHQRLPARAGFGFLHIGFNMYLLYFLGRLLEPRSASALRRASTSPRCWPARSARSCSRARTATRVGASGAVFGLMGAADRAGPRRGINLMQSGLGPTILHQPAVPVPVPRRNISIGGHIGGLIGGVVAGSRSSSSRGGAPHGARAAGPRLRRDRGDRARRHVLEARVKVGLA